MNADDALAELAAAAGVQLEWTDAHGRPRRVSPDTLRRVLDALQLPARTPVQAADSLARLRADGGAQAAALLTGDAGKPLRLPCPPGAYRLLDEAGAVCASGHLAPDADGGSLLPAIGRPGYYRVESGASGHALAIAPAAPHGLARTRRWGVAAQLYSLRRTRPSMMGGCGDFSALGELAQAAAAQGADAVAISPVHALFSADPARYSPYSPSSRLFLNAWYIDPDQVAGPHATAAALDELGLAGQACKLEAAARIDWPRVAMLRMAVLRKLFDGFVRWGGPRMQQAFERYRRNAGQALESHACFEALHAHLRDPSEPDRGWLDWPQALRRPGSPGVRTFAARHADEVSFHAFLQWQAAEGLAHAGRCARQAGMAIGLITDLAVGADPGGSHAWSRQDEIVTGLYAGAPPDIYNPLGQNWNLTAFSPVALRRHGYRAFIEMLRAALAGAGGIRVDHALGLARMWLVPDGCAPGEGAYLTYPFDDLLRLIALEAWRHGAIAIGENLGTVPAGFDKRIGQAGMLGMSVLWFEREADPAPDAPQQRVPGFRAPSAWRVANVAMTTTHDLPTCAGWWQASDLRRRDQLGLLGGLALGQAESDRAAERAALWQAMRLAGCADCQPPGAQDPPVAQMMGFVAASACPLALLPLEDVLAMQEQPNLPGTCHEHPNWVQRLPVPAGMLFDEALVQARIAAVRRARAQGGTP